MTFTPPNKVLISSDGSELELQSHDTKTGLYHYQYTKGETKVGTIVKWTQDYIEVQLKNYFKPV